MISVQNLSLQFGGQILFDGISFSIHETGRVGLVGKNGAGKTTLLRMLAGVMEPDEGDVLRPKGRLTGYLPQELNPIKGKTVFDEARSAFSEALLLDKQMHDLQHELSIRTDVHSDEYSDKINEMNEISHRLEIFQVNSIDKQVELVLTGLGFVRDDFYKLTELFSGGWQMRVELAKILLSRPELVLLDEPTNHLDIESIRWLEGYLQNYPGAILMVSHDRAFLDAVTTRTIEIVNAKIYDYPASYSKFTDLRKERIDQQTAALKNQEKFIEHTEKLIDKFRAKKNKAKFAQTLIKKLDRLEEIEVDDEESATIHFNFPQPPRSGKIIFEATHLSKSYDGKNVLRNVNFLIERENRIAFVGKNGEGKSTLSKILAGIEKYDGELKSGAQSTVGYYAQNQADKLNSEETVFDIIDKAATGLLRTRVRGLLGAFLFTGDAVYKKVKVLSGGEKSRLALCKLLLDPYNVLILDEPTNHLDMRSKDVLKDALLNFNGTVIIVSHDRDFLKGLTNRTFEFKDHGIKEFIGDIYDYLDAKKMSELKELERKEKKPGQKVTAGNLSNKQIYEEKKSCERELNKLQRAIEKTESEITYLEKEMKEAEKKMSSPENFGETNTSDLFLKYKSLQDFHAKKMEHWEKLHAELGKMN